MHECVMRHFHLSLMIKYVLNCDSFIWGVLNVMNSRFTLSKITTKNLKKQKHTNLGHPLKTQNIIHSC